MLPGEEHNKTWQVNCADGSVEYHSIRTPQPQMHALYRKWMNVVDLHNKLRQGVVSMADVWSTKSWTERHFAEGLGMWEVNVYKTLLYFCPKWKNLSHGEFRARLAWTMLTLGKHPYPGDVDAASSSTGVPSTNPGLGCLGVAALHGSQHEYVRHPGTSPHRCAYCGSCAYWKCVTCEAVGLGCITICGSKSARGRKCIDAHVRGDACKHATSFMSTSARQAMIVGARKRTRSAAAGSSSNIESSSSSVEHASIDAGDES